MRSLALRPARLLTLSLALAALALSPACSSGGSSDDDNTDSGGGGGGVDAGGADSGGGGGGGLMTIFEIQSSDASKTCTDNDFVNGQSVSIEAVVATGFDYPGGGNKGLYVQDKMGGPWAGLFAVVDTDDTLLDDLAIGDEVTLGGRLVEAFCVTRLEVDSAKKGGTSSVSTTTVDLDDIGEAVSGADKEQWESVLVQIKDLVVSEPNPEFGGKGRGDMWVGVDENDKALLVSPGLDSDFSYYLKDDDKYVVKAKKGDAIGSITGIVTFAFDQWRIIPVDEDAVAGISGGGGGGGDYKLMTVKEIQESDTSLKCKPDGFTNGPDVEVKGLTIVSAMEQGSVDGIFAQDDSGAWNGVYLQGDKGDDLFKDLQPGDVVDVKGSIVDFYCMTQIAVDELTLAGKAAGMPEAVTVTFADIGEAVADADKEQWEGVLVTISDVTASTINPKLGDDKSHGDFYVGTNDSDEGLMISPGLANSFAVEDPEDVWTVSVNKGDEFASITGVMRYSFEIWRLVPLDDDAMVSK